MIAGESERIPEISLTGISVNCLARGDLHNHLPIEATLGGKETLYPEYVEKLKTLMSRPGGSK